MPDISATASTVAEHRRGLKKVHSTCDSRGETSMAQQSATSGGDQGVGWLHVSDGGIDLAALCGDRRSPSRSGCCSRRGCVGGRCGPARGWSPRRWAHGLMGSGAGGSGWLAWAWCDPVRSAHDGRRKPAGRGQSPGCAATQIRKFQQTAQALPCNGEAGARTIITNEKHCHTTTNHQTRKPLGEDQLHATTSKMQLAQHDSSHT